MNISVWIRKHSPYTTNSVTALQKFLLCRAEHASRVKKKSCSTSAAKFSTTFRYTRNLWLPAARWVTNVWFCTAQELKNTEIIGKLAVFFINMFEFIFCLEYIYFVYDNISALEERCNQKTFALIFPHTRPLTWHG